MQLHNSMHHHYAAPYVFQKIIYLNPAASLGLDALVDHPLASVGDLHRVIAAAAEVCVRLPDQPLAQLRIVDSRGRVEEESPHEVEYPDLRRNVVEEPPVLCELVLETQR